jgi:RHS repeat-associated protein
VPARDVQYQYDRVGNRRVVVENGVPVQYTVNKLNQYTSVGEEPLSYDANGNLTSAPGLSLQYDSWNRLISAATESNLVLFAYDGRHRCVKRLEIQNAIGRTTIMIWGHEPSQGWGLLEERGPNGELLARHVHGPSIDDLVLSELNGAVYYYHQDHLNSTVAVTDENGNVVEQYRYDVYGQPYFYGPDGTPRAESALGLRFLFTGREWLSSLALYDYRHRAYSPSLGRFLQLDPLRVNSGNSHLFLYVGNGPCNNIDPRGLWTLSWGGQFNLTMGFATSVHIALAGGFSWERGFSGGVVVEGGYGVGLLASASLGEAWTVTNAQSVRDLEGRSWEIGGSAGKGRNVSFDYVRADNYQGIQISLRGVGGREGPLEVHLRRHEAIVWAWEWNPFRRGETPREVKPAKVDPIRPPKPQPMEGGEKEADTSKRNKRELILKGANEGARS